jgi:hypothetical protein
MQRRRVLDSLGRSVVGNPTICGGRRLTPGAYRGLTASLFVTLVTAFLGPLRLRCQSRPASLPGQLPPPDQHVGKRIMNGYVPRPGFEPRNGQVMNSPTPRLSPFAGAVTGVLFLATELALSAHECSGPAAYRC